MWWFGQKCIFGCGVPLFIRHGVVRRDSCREAESDEIIEG